MLLPWPHLAESAAAEEGSAHRICRSEEHAHRRYSGSGGRCIPAGAGSPSGYFDGKNTRIEYRYAEGNDERTRALVAELVQLKVDVLVTAPLPAIRAAKQATKTIPIVMVTTRDPVATGLIDSLARPGGNLTGVTRLTRELSGKRLELLKEVAPNISRVAVLGDVDSTNLKDYEPAAQALGIRLQSIAYKMSDLISRRHSKMR